MEYQKNDLRKEELDTLTKMAENPEDLLFFLRSPEFVKLEIFTKKQTRILEAILVAVARDRFDIETLQEADRLEKQEG